MTAPATQKDAKGNDAPPPANHLTTRKRLELLLGQLQNERSSFERVWRDVAKYVLPDIARFVGSDANKGNRSWQSIIDSCGTFALMTLDSGLMTGITSPARPWVRLSTPYPELNELASVKAWLHEVTIGLLDTFGRSNFYTAMHQMYQDLGAVGTSAMLIEEDDEYTIRCYPFSIGSYYIANDAKMRVRTFVRVFPMTVRQIVERFPWDNISPATRDLWRTGNTERVLDIVQAITMNREYDASKLESKFKPVASCYFEKASNNDQRVELLEEKGFDEWPLMVGRWLARTGDAYATVWPARVALGDIKQLQKGESLGLQALDKLVKPPMIGPPELERKRASILPGDITYDGTEATRGFRPVFQVKPEIQQLEFKQQQVRERINRAFYADLFLMISGNPGLSEGQPRTATEIEVRQEEKMLVLGTMLSQFNTDVLDPAVDRVFAIMLRRGEIPPPPPELEGVELKVEYISLLHAAQKAGALGQLDRFSNFLLALAAVDPSVLDKWDRDQTVDEYADMTGVAPRIVVPDDHVAAVRQARAKAEQAKQMAPVLKDAATSAKTLSETDTQRPSALSDLLAAGSPGLTQGT